MRIQRETPPDRSLKHGKAEGPFTGAKSTNPPDLIHLVQTLEYRLASGLLSNVMLLWFTVNIYFPPLRKDYYFNIKIREK